MDSVGFPLFEGYFVVEIPKNLKELLGENPLKLRNAVSKYNEFLETYGEETSITESEFHDDDDVVSWIYYTGMSFMFPDEKILVKVETRSQKMFEKFEQGIRSGKMIIYLKGTAIVSKKDDVENIDRNLLDISIKKVETYCDGKLHSYSPCPDEFLNIDKDVPLFNEDALMNDQLNNDVESGYDDDDDIPF